MVRKGILVIPILLFLLTLCGCGNVLNMTIGMSETEDNPNGIIEVRSELTNIDKNVSYENADTICLDELTEKKPYNENYLYENNCLVIRAPGDYVLQGKLELGSIVVSVHDDEVVHLILDNVHVQANDAPAIFVEQADKVVVTLPEGSENVLSDTAIRNETGREACLYSNSDITINGTGQLSLYGYYEDGIRSCDRVKILDADLQIQTKNDGIRGNDGVLLNQSSLHVESEGIGILAKSDKDFVIINNSQCVVIAGENAVSAQNFVSVKDSETDLYSVKEAIQCNGIKQIEDITGGIQDE